ncbi:TRAP-type C4-dicarboxylate transport system permease small subunit [Methylobacterium radiotolerans]
MSHGFDAATAAPEARGAEEPRLPGLLGAFDRGMRLLNRVILALGGLCLVAACLVLTHSVVVRYLLKEPTEWQDEMAVFLIIGATFLSAAGVQAKRGHVAIEALTGLLPPAANRVRLLLADLVSLAFCLFFAWKSWSLDHEAWVDGQVSQSTWGAAAVDPLHAHVRRHEPAVPPVRPADRGGPRLRAAGRRMGAAQDRARGRRQSRHARGGRGRAPRTGSAGSDRFREG